MYIELMSGVAGITCAALALFFERQYRSAYNKLHDLTRHNGKIGTYSKSEKSVRIKCLAKYHVNGSDYCVVENLDQPGTTIYSIPLRRITWNDPE